MIVQPQKAIVRPRIASPDDDGVSVPLEQEILALLQQNCTGVIAILGGDASGKTTALQHLAAMLAEQEHVLLLDEPSRRDLEHAHADCLFIYAASRPFKTEHTATLRLAGWGTDECIEYLLARHPQMCASVMKRVGEFEAPEALDGSPALWRIVLDEMADDSELADPRAALRRYFDRVLTGDTREQARKCSFAFMLDETQLQRLMQTDIESAKVSLYKEWCQLSDSPSDLKAAMKCRLSRLLLASELVLLRLQTNPQPACLEPVLPLELVKQIASDAVVISMQEAKPDEIDALRRIVNGEKRELQAMAASILHHTGIDWVPESGPLLLSHGYFSRAQWRGTDFSVAMLNGTDLSRADLSKSNLTRATTARANFSGADLREANLDLVVAEHANFTGARMQFVHATDAYFARARFQAADLTRAILSKARLEYADLRDARLAYACLKGANLRLARIGGTEFTCADLSDANLIHLILRECTLTGAVFARAKMHDCDLEWMELPNADFSGANLEGAHLTGTVIRKGNFANATLHYTGLAEIDWEGADLRGANLTNCSFHMGSSRSGRVYSPIACEGSKTGFYTDEFSEQGFKAPEQIRKANLRGADLRGAILTNTDFYLVDLRDAKYDDEQREHFKRCGAILEHRKTAY
ncbi:MAG TPA: pentapeptide repeat-containing protein [Planctomycetota bacterium]|nr:pentapeptide repeat-containing protein [Planctomycetota bacterium]